MSQGFWKGFSSWVGEGSSGIVVSGCLMRTVGQRHAIVMATCEGSTRKSFKTGLRIRWTRWIRLIQGRCQCQRGSGRCGWQAKWAVGLGLWMISVRQAVSMPLGMVDIL